MLTRRQFFKWSLLVVGNCVWYKQTLGGEKTMLGINKMIQVEMEKRNCDVEAYVNGIPMWRSLFDQPFNSVSAHEYLIDGVNKLELVVFPGPTPSIARTEQQERDSTGVYAEARLVKYLIDVYPGDQSGEVLTRVVWQGQDNKKEVFPKIVTEKTDLGPMFGRWVWQDAEKLVLNKQTMDEITKYIKNFHQAFSAGDGKFILNLAKMSQDATYRAYPGRDREEDDALDLQDFQKRKENPAWKVSPLNFTQFDFRLCAEDRIVEVINKDWKPTIRGVFQDTGRDYSYSMLLSRINGQFHMVL